MFSILTFSNKILNGQIKQHMYIQRVVDKSGS